MMADDNVNDVLAKYAEKKFTYREISSFLGKYHGLSLSTNAIRKRLKRHGVPSRKGPTIHSYMDVKIMVLDVLPELPVTAGYRYVTGYLRQNGIHVRRDTVMRIMREVDSDGVDFQHRRRIRRKVYRSMGPKYIWHVDGYDKLKPYGFPIHGCIDGFSRRIMWLRVACTNNDPTEVVQNYISCLKELKGCPLVLQADPGTENSYMGAIQCTLRHTSSDCFSGLSSFRVVKSVFNQTELDNLVDQWNNHYISRSKQASCPNGRPSTLYYLPDLVDAVDCLHPLSSDDINWLQSHELDPTISGSAEFDSYANQIFSAHAWSSASNWERALFQYINLTSSYYLQE